MSDLRLTLLVLTPVLFLVDWLYSFWYFKGEAAERRARRARPTFHLLFWAFFGAMMWSLTAKNVAMMWVVIELTTLVSAPLIIQHKTAESLEAMWKYLLICSVGIGLALFGTMLFLSGHPRFGFVFILCGYGTKMGLAPFHTWLPDAHSESPAPVSALLSGALLNCSFFAITRFFNMLPAADVKFATNAMITLGILSLVVAAVFTVRQTDFKRMLAYSSVEHMGMIMLIFAAAGGLKSSPAILTWALIIHIVFHSLNKTALFLTSGVIMKRYGTRTIAMVQGMFETRPGLAFTWMFFLMMICGMPPSGLMASEIMFVYAAPFWLSGTVAILLFIVFAGMMKVGVNMCLGRAAHVGAAHQEVR